MEISQEVSDGQKIYSKPVLSIYDFWVLGISNQFIWKCPTKLLLDHFNKHVSANHLDIGVGTGYFLDKCRLPSTNCRIGLMDLNQNSLNEAGKRIKRYKPSQYRFNVLDEVKLDVPAFDSISVNYLFHCLPGKLSNKLAVLNNVDHLLSNNGTVFGSTILSQGVKKSRSAEKLMSIYNKKGIFCNAEDNVDDLKSYLSDSYSDCKVEIQGCVAIFSAKNDVLNKRL